MRLQTQGSKAIPAGERIPPAIHLPPAKGTETRAESTPERGVRGAGPSFYRAVLACGYDGQVNDRTRASR